MPYLIVGVDPGNTVGLAAVDFEGRLVAKTHLAAGGLAEAVARIESWGTPSIIASDVRPAPEFVLKVASSFNAALHVPSHEVREEEKRRIIRHLAERRASAGAGRGAEGPEAAGLEAEVQNTHERDAIAAAVLAWRHAQNTLRMPSGLELEAEEREGVRHLMLQGFRMASAREYLRLRKAGAQANPPNAGEGRADQVDGRGPAGAPRTAAGMEGGGEPARRPGAGAAGPGAAGRAEEALRARGLELERQNTELRKRVGHLEAEREGLLGELERGRRGARRDIMSDWTVRKLQHETGRLRLELRRAWNTIASLRRQVGRGRPRGGPGGETDPPVRAAGHGPREASASRRVAAPAAHRRESLKEDDDNSRLRKILDEYRRGRAVGQEPRT